MRPVVFPEGWFPGAHRQIIGGENDTEPAEYVIEGDLDHRFRATALIQLDEAERDVIERVIAGQVFEQAKIQRDRLRS